MSPASFLVAPSELAENLERRDVAIVDASWYLPADGRDAAAEYAAAHVPGAVFFDQDAVVAPGADMPHTLPPPDVFAAAVGALGIAHTDTIVVYDGAGLFSAARVWWMFRTFGAGDVRVLDGGLPAWQAAGMPVESGRPVHEPKRFTPRFDAQAVADLTAMRRHVDAADIVIADARSAGRFAGTAPEPRTGVRSGHMPGARSLPFTDLVENGRLKDVYGLRAAFAKARIDPNTPVVTSCGSGVTAAILNLALETLGNRRSKLYDGSWAEWGSQPDTPVAAGEVTEAKADR